MKGAGETEADTPRPGLCHTAEVRRLRSDGSVVDILCSVDHFLFSANWRGGGQTGFKSYFELCSDQIRPACVKKKKKKKRNPILFPVRCLGSGIYVTTPEHHTCVTMANRLYPQ